MGWNGSGVVTRDNGTNSGANTWENDRDASIKITAENHDTHDQDLADAIQNTIAKDGQNFPTADLPMNNQKHTGVGAATTATHYARADQVQNGAFMWGGTAAGTADAITFNLTPTLTAYTTGLTVRFLASGNTTVTNPTININAAGAKTVKDQDGNALAIGDIASGTVYEAVYDGTDFRIYVAPSQDLSTYVTGPASSTDSAVALFDGTGGKTLKDGVVLGTSSGNIPQVGTKSATETLAGLVEKSTSAENVAGTDDTVFPSVAGVREIVDTFAVKAWANYDMTGTPAIRDSLNIDSLTDAGPGIARLALTNAMADANYLILGGTARNGEYICVGEASVPATASSLNMETRKTDTAAVADITYNYASAFGELA